MDHRVRYKNTGLDAKELRRRREENSVQLRKQKRDDVLLKRRTLAPANNHLDSSIENDDSDTSITLTSTEADLINQEVIDGLMQNDNPQLLVESARRVRKILSKEPQPPFDDVIQTGLVPRVVELLDRHDDTTIQFEVAWILTNICSGTTEQTRVVVDNGALPKLVNLVSSPDPRVCEQAVWALGNVIGDNERYRDLVIAHGFVSALMNLIRPDLEIGFLRNATWVIVNLCRNKQPPTTIDVIAQITPALLYLIQSTDHAILIDTTWAVSYITELGPDYSQLIIDSGIVNRMAPLLTHQETKIQIAAIRALGCITTGNEVQTQSVIDAGAIPHLCKILKCMRDKASLVKEALWFLSNITAGSVEQIQAVIDAGTMPEVVHYLKDGEFLQQREAVWTVFNYCLSGSVKQLSYLIDIDIIPALCDLLVIKDVNVVRNVMEAISCLLSSCSDRADRIRELIEQCGGVDKIEALQDSSNSDIGVFSSTILEKFFQEE